MNPTLIPPIKDLPIPTTSQVPGLTLSPSLSPLPSPTMPISLDGIAIAAGESHTCAVSSEGGVMCWGRNDHGQLGDGTIVERSTPVAVTGLSSGVKSIAAGWGHTCALTDTGAVKCWGYNWSGELGNGTAIDSSVPVDVAGLTGGVVSIAAGDDHTCAVMETGGVKCWGYNKYGQLGDGMTINSSTPVEVNGLTVGIKDVALGWGHTCALTESGAVLCWGDNESGQLGDGAAVKNRATRGNVNGLSGGVAFLAAFGGHTCVLTHWETVKCWGNNEFGQLGDGTVANRNQPVDVAGLPAGVVEIAAGWEHTCALTAAYAVLCWGWNGFGQLGDGTSLSRSHPEWVQHLAGDVIALAAGNRHTCALGKDGWIQCWGGNTHGQLGDGSNADHRIPDEVAGFTN